MRGARARASRAAPPSCATTRRKRWATCSASSTTSTRRGRWPSWGTIEAPPTEFAGLQDVFEKTLEHEIEVTTAINGLADTAFQEKDYSTFNFLQWYVAEQHEEEMLFRGILDKFEILGTDGKSLFMIDREIGRGVGQKAPPSATEPEEA